MLELNIPMAELAVDSGKPDLYLSGKVWITIDGHHFPERDWTDNPMSFLGSMHTAIGRAAGGAEADCYFWEGSYFVKLVPLPIGAGMRHIEVFAVDDGGRDLDEGGVVTASCVCVLAEIGKIYQAAISELSQWAYDRREADLLALLARLEPLPELG